MEVCLMLKYHLNLVSLLFSYPYIFFHFKKYLNYYAFNTISNNYITIYNIPVGHYFVSKVYFSFPKALSNSISPVITVSFFLLSLQGPLLKVQLSVLDFEELEIFPPCLLVQFLAHDVVLTFLQLLVHHVVVLPNGAVLLFQKPIQATYYNKSMWFNDIYFTVIIITD